MVDLQRVGAAPAQRSVIHDVVQFDHRGFAPARLLDQRLECASELRTTDFGDGASDYLLAAHVPELMSFPPVSGRRSGSQNRGQSGGSCNLGRRPGLPVEIPLNTPVRTTAVVR